MDSKKTKMTRRDVLRLGATTGAFALCRPLDGAGILFQQAHPSVKDLDHIMWGVPDLNEGIVYIKDNTGLEAIIGGVHPGRGTRNALIALGERQYLEVLALDPAQPDSTDERATVLRTLNQPRILTWIARTYDIDAVDKRVREAGLESLGIEPGSRNKPDGTVLKWRSLKIGGHGNTVVPFVIEWGKDTVHPSEDSPKGCTLRELQLAHPNPGDVNPFLEAMGLSIRATEGSEPKITAILDSPKGRVVLS